MRVPGFEPGTSALSELRSSQLSYTPGPVSVNAKAKPIQVWPSPTNRSPGESYPSDGLIISYGVRIVIGKRLALVVPCKGAF